MSELDEKKQGALVGVEILSGVAAAVFGAAAFLTVWDVAGKFHPVLGFLQNIGLALACVGMGLLAAYLRMRG